MIALQAGLGFVNAFAGFLFAIAIVLATVYFLVLPGYVFLKQTKAWKTHTKCALALSYIVLISIATIIFWVLPDYCMANFSVDIIGSWYHRLSMYLFFSLPLAYSLIVCVWKVFKR